MKKICITILIMLISSLAYAQSWGGLSSVTKEFPLPVSSDNTRTAFGSLLIAELTPVFQNDFSYNVNTQLWDIHANNGTVTTDSNRLKISTGSSANQSAGILSRTPIKYRPGQGALIRFTALFTTGVSNSTQVAGVGDVGDGYFFGYNGTSFGILRRSGGNQAVHQLIVTTKATSAGTVTIKLDGDDKEVEVTDATSGDVTTTANDIGAGDFSNIGMGWETHVVGDKVLFFAYDAVVKSGSFSFTDTDTTGAAVAAGVTTTLAGVAPTDNWVAQTSWSEDKADGTEHLPLIDFTKGNVFEIRYQWLGYGLISFYIENPANGELDLVHKIEYANANTLPSVNSPSLPLMFQVNNASNTSDIIIHSGSAAGFIEGKFNGNNIHHGAGATVTNSGTSEVPILTIHNKRIYQGKINRNQIRLTYSDISVDHTKNSIIKFRYNPILTGASYTDIDTNTSMISIDSSATSVSGGKVQLVVGMAKDGSRNIPLADVSFFLNPGDKLTVTQESTSVNGAVTTASFNWEELF